jgi:hypothetical protein
VAVGRAHHGNLDSLIAQASDTSGPLSFDRGPPFELETELAKEVNRRRKVIDDDSYVVHPFQRHVSNLQTAVSSGNGPRPGGCSRPWRSPRRMRPVWCPGCRPPLDQTPHVGHKLGEQRGQVVPSPDESQRQRQIEVGDVQYHHAVWTSPAGGFQDETYAHALSHECQYCLDRTGVRVQIDGTFDRTGLPDPLVMNHEFKVAEGKIAELRIGF